MLFLIFTLMVFLKTVKTQQKLAIVVIFVSAFFLKVSNNRYIPRLMALELVVLMETT